MTLLQFAVPVGALEAVSGELPYVILALVLVNLVTRHMAHSSHTRAVENGAETLSRYTPHIAVSAVLVLTCFLYMIVEPHSGMVISVLVVGAVIADFFEFEARLVEVRNNMELEAPKSAITVSFVALLYALYISLFWVIKGPWEAVI